MKRLKRPKRSNGIFRLKDYPKERKKVDYLLFAKLRPIGRLSAIPPEVLDQILQD